MIRQLLALISFLLLSTAPPASYDALKREAEKHFDEKSFAKAHEVYERASKLDLPADERRWVTFRLADTAWRAAEDEDRDSTVLDQIAEDANHDRVWAEANESLGDFSQNFTNYTAALDWWAGSDDLELARERYLGIVEKMGESSSGGQQIPREVLVNTIALARSPEKARSETDW